MEERRDWGTVFTMIGEDTLARYLHLLQLSTAIIKVRMERRGEGTEREGRGKRIREIVMNCVCNVHYLYFQNLDPKPFSIRLVGGANTNEGRVQVYYNGWKSVCGNGWDFRDARVVCRQLGYGDALSVPTSPLYGVRGWDELSFMDDVDCLGEETLLRNCRHDFGNLDCSRTSVASAVCTGEWWVWSG